MASAESPEIRWLQPDETPWPVPVLDVRPVTLTMIALTDDRQMAANAISYLGDDGLGFVGRQPAVVRTTPLSLRYPVDPVLADGQLFQPENQDHRWALYHHSSKLLFVRSWERRVAVTAETRPTGDGYVEVTEAQGAFAGAEEEPAFTAAAIDFIIRTHALGLAFPAPLLSDPGADLESAALACLSLFGNLALFATHHRFAADPPERPLRSASLFHIALARGDLNGAREQLDAGIPIDLLAGDGLTAMHWAAAGGNLDTLSWLVSHGVPIDARSTEGATALMHAVQDDKPGLAVWLLEHGADPNAHDQRGFTSLHRAAEIGLERMVRLLLVHGSRTDPIAQGYTALELAQRREHRNVVALLAGHSDR